MSEIDNLLNIQIIRRRILLKFLFAKKLYQDYIIDAVHGQSIEMGTLRPYSATLREKVLKAQETFIDFENVFADSFLWGASKKGLSFWSNVDFSFRTSCARKEMIKEQELENISYYDTNSN